ncbi:MAG TPA: CpsD/CapB family tyrosine-protein kinase, partial [Syntrophorhabdaceae bacterium]|nr:CpsD/CapB family tyrosine-protein kinase [Syntrophorhabdaceae bacterium]
MTLSNSMENVPTNNKLVNLKNMYGSFYKAIWKLILEKESDETNKKKGFAISFAGCRKGDGASTMSVNFAAAFSENTMEPVVLVDADLRNPILHQQFQLKNEKGISDVINGKVGLLDAIKEIKKGTFFFIPAGTESKNPTSLFSAPVFDSILKLLRDMFSLIIFDLPPILGNPESTLIANKMDGLILVLNADVTRWEVARAAKNDLETADVKILGAILNKKEFVIPQAIYRL